MCSRCQHYYVSLYNGVILSEPVKESFIVKVGGLFSRDINAGSVAVSLRLRSGVREKRLHKLGEQIAMRVLCSSVIS